MSFTPRTTEPTGTALNTYWTDFTGECVWYTIGRIREVAGTPKWDPDRAWPVTLDSIQEAKQIYPNADEVNGWIKDGNTPSLGAIACWTGTAGHCMNVEAINGNRITLSGYNFPDYHSFALLTYDLDTIINNRISGLGAFQGFIRNPYVEPGPGPGGHTPTITITPSSGDINIGGYIQIEITAEYIDASDTDPYPSRDQSPGLSREWVTSGWQVTTYTEDGITYQRAYGVMKILASAGATNPGWVKFYHTFVNGYAEATGYYNIIDDETELLLTVFKKKKKVKEYIIKLI